MKMVQLYFDGHPAIGDGYRTAFVLGEPVGGKVAVFVWTELEAAMMPADRVARASEVEFRSTFVRSSMLRKIAYYRRSGTKFAREEAMDVLRVLGAGRQVIRQSMETETDAAVLRQRELARLAAQREADYDEAICVRKTTSLLHKVCGTEPIVDGKPLSQLVRKQSEVVVTKAGPQWTMGF